MANKQKKAVNNKEFNENSLNGAKAPANDSQASLTDQIKAFLTENYDFQRVGKQIEFSEKGKDSFEVLDKNRKNDLLLLLQSKGIKAKKPDLDILLDSSFVPKKETTAPPETSEKTEKSNEPQITRVKKYLDRRYEFRNNIIRNVIESRKKGTNNPFEEANENNLFCELLEANFQIGQNLVSALMKSDFVVIYDPLKEYLENLPKWTDDQPDYITNLANAVKTHDYDQARYLKHFKKMMVRVIASVYVENFGNKQALTLMGGQNKGKSRFCEFLCPPALKKYQKDSLSLDKDGEISLATMFWIIIDELKQFPEKELSKVKSMMQRTNTNIRRPFERRETQAKRIANFIANTNHEDILNDETGSVRWICFEVLDIDWKFYTKHIDINLVYAQAYALFKQGFEYELTSKEVEENETANARFKARTIEMELILKFIRKGTKDDHEFFWQATDVLRKLHELTENKLKINKNNIGKALTALKFKNSPERTEHKDYPIWGYYIKLATFEDPYESSQKYRSSQITKILFAYLDTLTDGVYTHEAIKEVLKIRLTPAQQDNISESFLVELLQEYCKSAKNDSEVIYCHFAEIQQFEIVSVQKII